MKNHSKGAGPRLVRAAVNGELRSPTAPCSQMDLCGVVKVGGEVAAPLVGVLRLKTRVCCSSWLSMVMIL